MATFDIAEIHATTAAMRRDLAADLATLANMSETGRFDGPWSHAGGVVTGPSGLRVAFTGTEAAVICPTLYSGRLAPRGARSTRVVIHMDVADVWLDDLGVYVRGIDMAIRQERAGWEDAPERPVNSAEVRDNATAAAVELAADNARRNGRYLTSL